MGRPSKEVLAFMETYKIDSDEIWEVHGSTWVVKHRALERVAAEQGVVFDRPAIIENNAKEKIAVICVFGKLNDRDEWSIGEASPANNKNAYCYAMAEKRGKDRVILKLLNAHGSLYSEAEADEFKEDAPKTTLPKKDARTVFEKMQREIQECQTRDMLKEWGGANKDRISMLPDDWQDILRLQCTEMMADLRNKETT